MLQRMTKKLCAKHEVSLTVSMSSYLFENVAQKSYISLIENKTSCNYDGDQPEIDNYPT